MNANRFVRGLVAVAIGLVVLGQMLRAQPVPFPLKPGMAVVTCFSGYDDVGRILTGNPVAGIVDVNNAPDSLRGLNWSPPMFHGPGTNWNAGAMGQVFGIAIDSGGTIYLTETTCYGRAPKGPDGMGAIYRIDGRTGAVSLFATLPNTVSGLGNICYDRDRDQLLVTNFEDGRIYRLNRSGAILSRFDPLAPYNGAPGFAPLGDRLWGVGVYANRVYYGVWACDLGRQSATARNEVRSVALDPSGEFDGATDRHEIWMPPVTPGAKYSAPISHITFSTAGNMLVSERGMSDDITPFPHRSRVLEFQPSGGGWSAPKVFYIGNFYETATALGQNSSGGADYGYGSFDTTSGIAYGCDSLVWATGDALRDENFNPDGGPGKIYGLVGMPASGNTGADAPTTSHYIDVDGDTLNRTKTSIGDLAIFRFCPRDTAYSGRDQVTICRGDSVTLPAPEGVLYEWDPDTTLSCTGCRNPVASPDSTRLYHCTISGADGSKLLHDVLVTVTPPTVIVQPRIGPADRSRRDLVVVPVLLDTLLDGENITDIRLDLRFPYYQLGLRQGEADTLVSMVAGTLLKNWIVTIVQQDTTGHLIADLRAPAAGITLKGLGTLLTLGFTPYLSFNEVSNIVVTLTAPGHNCLELKQASDTLMYPVCAASQRLIERLPGSFALNGNHPNPFNPTTRIDFSIGLDGPVRIEVFNAGGGRVATLFGGYMRAGGYSIDWNASDCSSGLYYARITSGSWSATSPMLLLK